MYEQNQIRPVLNAPQATGNAYLTAIRGRWQKRVRAND